MKKNEQIIKKIEILLIELKQSLNIENEISLYDGKHKIIPNQKQQFSGLTGSIYELIEEGFLNDPKTISDLQKKLKDRGIKKPTTSLMPSLKILIIKKVLDRNKPKKGLYQYFKRQQL
ncbi:MAG: hypothetical protein KAQ87_01560 [Candidatus Pacebacteria bacterium]|nr:hypothetical protein [Candidatus Paceibacterota bacterium]